MPLPAAVYRPRNPQSADYYRCVEDYFEPFVRVYDEHFSKQYGFWRPYVERVIYLYLDCGDPHNGFARVKCKDCGHEYLLAYSWPVNIRELQNVVERAVILSNGQIDADRLNLETQPDEAPRPDGLLSITEWATIEKILREAGGNRKRTAQILGISLRTRQYRIKEYGIK